MPDRLGARLMRFRPKQGRPPVGKVGKAETATCRRVFKTLTGPCPSPSVANRMSEGAPEQAQVPAQERKRQTVSEWKNDARQKFAARRVRR